jgi:hypothetical protein
MRITAILSFAAVVYIESAAMAAQQPTNGLPPQKNVFGNLLQPPVKAASPPRLLFPTPTFNQRPSLRIVPKSTVVCGLTLIPADPSVDSAIRHDVPEDGPRFSIRSVEPKLCRTS